MHVHDNPLHSDAVAALMGMAWGEAAVEVAAVQHALLHGPVTSRGLRI